MGSLSRTQSPVSSKIMISALEVAPQPSDTRSRAPAYVLLGAKFTHCRLRKLDAAEGTATNRRTLAVRSIAAGQPLETTNWRPSSKPSQACVRECDCECVHRDTVTDDCVHRGSDSDIVHSVSATVNATVYTVTVWQSGCGCTQRPSDCKCVHRGRVTVTATAYTVRQCDIVTVQQ